MTDVDRAVSAPRVLRMISSSFNRINSNQSRTLDRESGPSSEDQNGFRKMDINSLLVFKDAVVAVALASSK